MSAELVEEWRTIVMHDGDPDARLKVSRSELRRLFEAMDVEQVVEIAWCVTHAEIVWLDEDDPECWGVEVDSPCDVRPLFIRVQP